MEVTYTSTNFKDTKFIYFLHAIHQLVYHYKLWKEQNLPYSEVVLGTIPVTIATSISCGEDVSIP